MIDLIILMLLLLASATLIISVFVFIIWCIEYKERKDKRQKDIKNFIDAINKADIK